MRRVISASKHNKYLETVQGIIENLPKNEVAPLVGQLDKLDSTFQEFYDLLENARSLAKKYDHLQTKLTKEVRHSVVTAKKQQEVNNV